MARKYIINYVARHIDGNIVTEHRGTVMADSELTEEELRIALPHDNIDTLTFTTTIQEGV